MTPVFERLRGALTRSVGASIIVLAAIGSLPSVRALPAEQKTAEAPKPAAPPPPVAISARGYRDAGTEVSNLLVILTTSAAASADIESISKTLPDISEKLDRQLARNDKEPGSRA